MRLPLQEHNRVLRSVQTLLRTVQMRTVHYGTIQQGWAEGNKKILTRIIFRM